MNTFSTNPAAVVAALEDKADPDVVERGHALRRQRRVRILGEEPDGERVVVRGTVVGTRAIPHQASLQISPSRLQGRCDCGRKKWPCKHVLALAQSWADSWADGAGRQPGLLGRSTGWRDLLGALAPRPRRPLPEAAGELFAHWVELRRRQPGAWTLAISWRIHKVGPKGIRRGRALALGSLIRNPPECTTEMDQRVISAAVRAGGERPYGTAGSWVELDGRRADGVLRALSQVSWAYWAGSRNPVEFEPRPISVCLEAAGEEGGLWLRAGWRQSDGSPWFGVSPRVVRSRPPWVEVDGVLRPVLGADDGQALALLLDDGVQVSESDLPEFLGSAVPQLEARGIEVEIKGLGDRRFVIGETPIPRLYLSEEGGALVSTLRFAYGDYEIAAENPEAMLAVGAGDHRTYLKRDMETEFRATQRLRELGFGVTEPGRFEIQGDEALDFLRRDLDGIARDWEVFGRDDLKHYRVVPTPVSLRVRLGANIDWLDLSVEAEAEGDEVAAQELVRALRAGSRYVRLGSGAQARLPAEWLRRLRPALESLNLRTARVRLPHHMAPLVEEVVEGAPEVDFSGREVWDRLISALRGRAALPDAPLPSRLIAKLRPYQEWGYRWLRFMGDLGLGCVLADDMGLGKTVQALAVLLAEVEGGRQGPSLAVAPTSVVPNWEAEARRFAPSLRVLRYHGTDRKQFVGAIEGHHLVVTSYAVLRRDIRELSGVEWNYVILDEAQAIKNAATQTARAARKLAARRRMVLTGTPLENHLGELWSQFHFLMPGLLGSEHHFTRTLAKPIVQGDEDARERLRRRIRPFILRRLKSEVAQDLPEKLESVLLCEMHPEQERLYRSILAASRERVLNELEDKGLAGARFTALEALLRLRQACCHPEILPGGVGLGVASAKFDLFRDFVSEVLEEGHRVLVFSQFVKVLGVLRRWFQEAEIPHLYLDGRTRNREEQVRRFQEDESMAAFLVSLKAGGAGLNLTGADYVILYDPWWNPAVETQAIDRAHRIGQTRKVFAYKMITQGTVEEKVLTLQERKRNLAEDLIRSGGSWATSLTEAEIEELFEE